ncbi:MAG: hypothetical protein KKD39_02920 [Candidatus Altiarchaeota archaeon]|nr:hypothetical protein [Candidatus Altiarchaeota archaeon]
MLSEAFLSGQTYLLVQPDPEILNLSDPYDPLLNYEYRLHDASLFDGKYFLYFSPVPAILFHMPYYLVFGSHLPSGAIVFLLACGIFVFGFKILSLFKSIFFKKTPYSAFIITSLALAFGNISLFMLLRPAIWETAALSEAFFYIGGLYFLFQALFFSKKNILGYFLLSGCFLSLSVFSKPISGISVAMVCAYVLLYIGIIVSKGQYKKRDSIRFFAVFILPQILVLCLILGYNYVRFGDVFEFGLSYQLPGWHQREYLLNRFEPFTSVWPNLYNFFFRPPELTEFFPYLHMSWGTPDNAPADFRQEGAIGLFYLSPYLLLSLMVFPIYLLIAKGKIEHRFFYNDLFHICIIILLSIFGIAASLTFFPLTCIRYLMTISNCFLLLSSIGVFLVFDQMDSMKKTKIPIRKIFLIILIVLLLATVYSNVFLTLFDYWGFFKEYNPTMHYELKYFFECRLLRGNCFLHFTPGTTFNHNINEFREDYSLSGFMGKENAFRWTDNDAGTAKIIILSDKPEKDLRIKMDIGRPPNLETMIISVNGVKHVFHDWWGGVSFNIKKDQIVDRIVIEIESYPTFRPNEHDPNSLDPRPLGVLVRNITIEDVL